MLHTTKDQTFGGVKIQQTWSALWMLEKVLTEFKPDLIIEIGTGYGALSIFFDLHAETVTFDNQTRDYKGKVTDVTYVTADVFQPENILRVKGLIDEVEKVFLFCDGGDKAKEFEIFAPMMKPGDMIFVHDWGVEINHSHMRGIKVGFIPVYPDFCDDLKTLLRGYKRKGE